MTNNILYISPFKSFYFYKKLILVFLLFGIVLSFSPALNAQNESEILAELKQQQQHWNEGDLEGFMSSYYRSDSISFISSSGVNYGWINILDRYKKAYPTQELMGKLNFELIELKKLADPYYQCLGKYTLLYPDSESSGYFSLLWQRIDDEWKIISDHTSASVKSY